MNLPKAIEIGELNIKEAGNKMPPDCRDALLLLIEAAKRFSQMRPPDQSFLYPLLPGETEN